MLTSIGRFLRKLRIDNGEILKDKAEALGVSSAFLSAVENGKKKMPEGWIEKLKSIYSFTTEQAEALQAAVIDTNDAVELNLQNATPGNRALAISFAREFDSLDDETSRKIFEILKRRKDNVFHQYREYNSNHEVVLEIGYHHEKSLGKGDVLHIHIHQKPGIDYHNDPTTEKRKLNRAEYQKYKKFFKGVSIDEGKYFE